MQRQKAAQDHVTFIAVMADKKEEEHSASQTIASRCWSCCYWTAQGWGVEVTHIYVEGCSRTHLLCKCNGTERWVTRSLWLPHAKTPANKYKLTPCSNANTHTQSESEREQRVIKAQRQFPSSSSRGSSSTIVLTGSRPRALSWEMFVQKLHLYTQTFKYIQGKGMMGAGIQKRKKQQTTKWPGHTVVLFPSPSFYSLSLLSLCVASKT